MKMTIAYKIDTFNAAGTQDALSCIVSEQHLDTMIDQVIIPSLEDGEEYKVTKIAYSEVLDE